MKIKMVLWVTISAIITLTACTKTSNNKIFNPETPKTQTQTTGTKFDILSPEQSGITFSPKIEENAVYNFSIDPYIYNGGGVAVIDVNNDGLQDLLFTARLQGCHLYLNKGNLKFEDISESSGIKKFGGLKTGATVVDINADGWQDIYLCRTWLMPLPDRRNLLFINNKNGTFTESAKDYGLDDLSASQHANFFDYDGDGDLDLYLMNHPVEFKTMNNLESPEGNVYNGSTHRNTSPKNEYESDRLYRNEGNGKFTDVSQKAGIWNRGYGLSTLAADFNDDGKTDIFVGNDFIVPDFLYINNGNGTFTNRAADYFKHCTNHSMGADFADLSGDGKSDLFVLDMLAETETRRRKLMSTMMNDRNKLLAERGYGQQTMRNTLQLNMGDGKFSEIACLTGMAATDWSWATLIADFDNDGQRDVFISNGILRDMNDMDFFLYTADSINHAGGVNPKNPKAFEDFAKLMPSEPQRNFLYQNRGNLHFENVSENWGITDKTFSSGAAYADLDNDGNLDLITCNMNAAPSIYVNKNEQTNKHKALQIRLLGTPQNPMGIGAKVRVYAKGEMIFAQEMTNVRGYYSSVEAVWQVGLGEKTQADKIELQWPNGKFQVFENVPAGRITLKISEAKTGKIPPLSVAEKPIFQKIAAPNFRHQENQFEDFDREKLLPRRYSRLGPALAKGDLNGDGAEDFFVGGAAEQAGAIFLQNSEGVFSKIENPNLDLDKACEDVAATIFDADGDGDADLYVVSGGNEKEAGHPNYQDRLYLNDGKGFLKNAYQNVPRENTSGGCVTPFDFDNDGDFDLFVGGRITPGRFPETPQSLILQNEKGVFKNICAEIAPDFEKCGMVTDVKFADFDGDQKAEMLVSGDWMPLKIFKYEGQKFADVSKNFGLENTSGWWNCLTVADFDGDGDLDFAAGNEGENTRFRATETAPIRLFAKDFDGNGALDPILCTPENGKYYPSIMRDRLAVQMPGLVKKKFARHSPYSAAAIEQIIPESDLLSSQMLDAQLLASCWFENTGGKFVKHILPKMAQFAPIKALIAEDINGDGLKDLLTFGNDSSPEPDTYTYDASFGAALLSNRNTKIFDALMPQNSGLWAGGEVRGALVLPLKNGGRVLLCANNNGVLEFFKL